MKVLIIIDVQNIFVNDKNKFIINGIRSLLSAGIFDKIIFTVFINNRDSSFVKYLHWNKAFRSKDTDIVDDLKPYSKILVERSTFSAFGGKDIFSHIGKNDQLYLCGLDTDACVLATAYEGIDLGFDIKIIEDLIFSTNRVMHNFGFKIMKRNIPNVLIRTKSVILQS